MPEVICKCGCKRKKEVRQADINRGWGLFFSKSCKARDQSNRFGGRKYSKQRNVTRINFSPDHDKEELDSETYWQDYDDSDELNDNYGE